MRFFVLELDEFSVSTHQGGIHFPDLCLGSAARHLTLNVMLQSLDHFGFDITEPKVRLLKQGQLLAEDFGTTMGPFHNLIQAHL